MLGFVQCFGGLVRRGSFLACWRQPNITPIPKGPQSSSVANYRPISITSVLSRVFEPRMIYGTQWFVLDDLWNSGNQFAYRKDLGTCDALLCMSQTLHSALESGQEAKIVKIDFRQPLIWSIIRAFSIAFLYGYLRFCVDHIDTVSIKPITARYVGWLSETG